MLEPIVSFSFLKGSNQIDTPSGTEFASPSAGQRCLDRPSDCKLHPSSISHVQTDRKFFIGSATYLVQPGDTCYTIASHFNNFTLSVFEYWNPDVGSDCLSLQAFVPVCINTPWYTFTPPVQKPVGTIEVAANQPAIDQPFPIVNGAASDCKKYELAGEGVFEFNMVQSNNITTQEFEEWNPNVKQVGGTQAGYWYCVGI